MGFLDRLVTVGAQLGNAALNAAEQFAKATDPAGPGVDGGKTTGADQDPVVEAAQDDPQAIFWDPYAIVEQLGYKDKPSPITYATLDAMFWRMPVIQGIHLTRLSQISAFARPQRNMFETGFAVGLRDDKAKMDRVDRKYARQMEEMIMTTGVTENPLGRDSFEAFLKKLARDSLKYDQGVVEIVRNRKGEPAQFFAVDAATIRRADVRGTFYDEDAKTIRYVQIYDNMVVNQWDAEHMAFWVRNPSTSIRNFGYGISEMEMLITSITAFLYGFDYNSRFFSQGSVAKGLLNIKGPMNQKFLKAFRRQWYTMVSGVENAWRSPVLNAEDVQWLNMQPSNRDMEFSAFMDFLIKMICAVYLIDPQEVNFKYGNTGQQRAMFEAANKQKLVESKDKGLKPILRGAARLMTDNIVRPINPDFEFRFMGLEAQTPMELADLNSKRVKTTHTVNELRAEWDLEAIDGGDILLDPTFLQAKAQEMAMSSGMGMGGPGMPQGPENGQNPDELKEEHFAALANEADNQDEEEEDYGEDAEKSLQSSIQKARNSGVVTFDVTL